MLKVTKITHAGDGPNDQTTVGYCLSDSEEVLSGLMSLQDGYGRAESVEVWETIEDLPQKLQERIRKQNVEKRENEITKLVALAKELAERRAEINLTPEEAKLIDYTLNQHLDGNDIPF